MTDETQPELPATNAPAEDSFTANSDASADPDAPAVRPSVALVSGGPSAAGPSYVFFGGIAAVALLADVATKAWAEITLTARSPHDPSIVLVDNHLAFNLAYNRGGAWGLL